MFEVLTNLFDPTGFPPRKECGTGWTPALVWLHITSDLFIWLAYVSIPLVLLHFTRRRDFPFHRLFVLFALFILACGTTHLIDAIIFEFPIYRFAGVMKAVTAVVSWATVIALVPIIPRVMQVVTEAAKPGAETKLHRALPSARAGRTRDYIVGVLAGVLAVLVRTALDPLLGDDHTFIIAMLAVVYVSWQHGFGPGVLCLFVALVGFVYFFVPPRNDIFAAAMGKQLAIGLFFFCGVACAALGESQRGAQRRAKGALATAVARQDELEAEVVRRRVVEAALRQRELDLVKAQRDTAEALARLNAFLDNAPLGIAFFDTELRYVRINPFLAAANGKPVEEHLGKPLPEMLPDFPPDVLDAYRRLVTPRGAPFSAQFRRPDARRPGGSRTWQVTAFPVRAHGGLIGAGVVAQDVTDQRKAEEELKRSERNLSDFFENANVGLHWVGPDGIILRANQAELAMLGYSREEYVGRSIAEFHADRDTICDILERLGRGERIDDYPARLRCKDGSLRDVVISSSVLWEDGRFVHTRCFTRDVTDLKRAADELAEQARASALRADVAAALTSDNETRAALGACADTLVRHVGAAFARIWTTDKTGEWLDLQASAGMYTHTDGPHARVPVGQFKIGRIAKSRTPHLTNDVKHDPNVSDPTWAAREGMVSFAGFPLVVEGRVLGVMALFARQPLSDTLMADLGPVAASIAQFIDRREATEAVKESEARFRTLAEAVPQMVWSSRPDGYVDYFNDRWYDFTGFDRNRSGDGSWEPILHPDDVQRCKDAWYSSVDSGRPYQIEYRFHDRTTGGYRWFLGRALPQRDAAGRVVRWYGTCTDIHDARAATEVLRENEERYRLLTEAVPNVVWNADADGRLTYVNTRWVEWTALPKELARGDGWFDTIHPDDRERVRDAWRDTVENVEPGESDRFVHEFRLRNDRTGEYRWFLSVAVPLRHNDGTVDRWIGSMTDIHDQKSAAESIRESEAFRRSVFENSPDCLKIIDLDGRVLEINEAGCQLMEVDDPATVCGARWADLWPAATGDTIREAVAAARAGRVGRFQGFCPTAKGTPKFWDVSVAALPGADGRPARLIGVSRDVTEQRRAEERVRESQEMFRQLAESIPQLAWMTDAEGYIHWYNQRWYDYTGTTFEEMQGWGWQSVHDPDELPRVVEKFKSHIASGEAWEDTFPLRGRDGKFRWHLSRAMPMRDAGGDIVRWFGTNTDVTAQRELEQSLRASEMRFRTLTEALPQIVWTADPDGEVTYLNHRWLEHTAIPVDEAQAGAWVGGLHPDDRDRVYNKWRHAVGTADSGGPARFAEELRLVTAGTGEYRWFQCVAVPLRRADGKIEQWIGSMSDVHEQKTATARVQEANEFLEATINALSKHIAVLDPHGVILKVNEAWRRFGDSNGLVTPAHGVGSNYFDVCAPHTYGPPADWHDSIRRVIRGDRSEYTAEYPCHAPHERRWFQMRVNRFPGKGPVKVVVSHENITARVLAEEAVRASELRFRSLTEAVPQIVWTADPAGEVTFFNRRWDEYTGMPLAARGEPGWGENLIHSEDADRMRADWHRAVADAADDFTNEFRLRRAADGAYRWMLSVAVPFRDSGGKVVEWVGTITDIDDQKRYSQTLERVVGERTAELKRSNGELEKFAYVASHDLQEPLRKIQAFGDRLQTKCREQLPDNGKEYVDRMLSAAGRMRRLIDDLLTFSRVTTEKRPFARVELGKVVNEVVSDLEVRLTQSKGTVVVKGLPTIDADPTQMRQLFQNLIANAVKFQRPGVPPVVEVSGELVGQPPDPDIDGSRPACRITVRDNGIGFDEKYRDRIFAVFQRLHGRDEYEGTGVGLAICRKIAERHGGTITAHSREGEGTTFEVVLPARHNNHSKANHNDDYTE